jgi:hypothetical protein
MRQAAGRWKAVLGGVTWFALSLKQPWAWAVLNAGKTIENRVWPAPQNFIGRRVLLHASSQVRRCDFDDWSEAIEEIAPGVRVPPYELVPMGAIVGAVTITGCDHPLVGPEPRMRGWWATDQFGWHLADAWALPEFVPCKGAQKFWPVPAIIEARIREMGGKP